MEHEEDEREAGQPMPKRGPLRFVDNGTGKRRFWRTGKRTGSGALLGRQRGKEVDGSPAAREGSKESSAEKAQSGRTVTRPEPKATNTTGTTANKQSQKPAATTSSAAAPQTTANVAGGGERGRAPRGNTAGKAWALILMAVALGFAAYASVMARGERIAELFPDQALQEYIQEEVDSNGDGRLNEEEILGVHELDGFQDRGIKSLAGLEIFSNLERLDASGAGAVEIFRVHNRQWSLFGESTKKEIRSHFLENLTSLDLSDNELSGEINFRDSCPNLVDLNISNNSLEGFELASGATIESFDCSNNAFEGRLYLKPGIRNLNCAGNQLVQIVITSDLFESNGPLDSLYCQDNQLVSMLDGNNPLPYNITVVSKDKVDISNNPGIWIENVRENGVVEIGYAKLNP